VVQGDASGEAGIEAIVQLYKQLSESVAQGQARVSAPPRGWKRHTDRSIPTVSVHHPEGWQVFSVARNSSGLAVDFAQVRVASPDGLHLVEGFGSMTTSLVEPDVLIDQKLAELAQRLGPPQLLREEEWAVQTGAMLTTEWRVRAVRAGQQIVVLVAAAQNVGGYGTVVGRAALRTVVGPAPQFSAFVGELYVPILNSMTGW
jgi:hypothetical protein